MARNLLTAIYFHQGKYDIAWDLISLSLPDGPEQHPDTTCHLDTLIAQRLAVEIELERDDLEAARNWLESHDSWLMMADTVLGQAESQLLWARYYLADGDSNKAREQTERALELASNPRQPLALLSAHRLQGAIEVRQERYADAEGHLEQSRLLANACEIPIERAWTLVEIARLRIVQQDGEAVRLALSEARTICESLQAQPALDVIAGLEAQVITVAEAVGEEDVYGLSPRELEVLHLLVDGKTDREIAEELFISPRTAMSHVANIRNKLGVDSRTAAVGIAIREGLV